MQQSGIFRNEKLHEYRYPAPVCYNHGGKKCQKYVKITAKILNACTECTGLICTPAKDNDEWESYRKIFDFIPEPPESNIPPCK